MRIWEKDGLKKYNKIILIMLIIQMTILLFLLLHLVDKRKEMVWNFKTNNYVTDDGISNIELELTNEFITLPFGAYNVEVEYLVDSPDDLNAYVQFYSEKHPCSIINSKVELKAGNKKEITRIWIPFGNSIDDFKIVLSSNAYCRIDSIRISEILGWRILRILGFSILFALIDSVIWIFGKHNTIPLEKRKVVLGLIGIVFITILPELTNFSHNQHDANFNYNRILAIEEALFNGSFPVRIHFRLLHGYGFANSIFYGDILLYLPAILYHLGMALDMAYKVYLIVINIGTVLIAYWCFLKISQNRNAALLGTLVYAIAPYRLTNTMVRCAVGEYTAMMFLPLVIYGIYHIYKKDDNTLLKIWDLLPLIFGVSGVIESHVLSTEMVLVFALIFCLINIRKTLKIKRLIGLLKTVGIVILLNTWFIIPFIDYARMPFKIQESESYLQDTGLYLAQIFSIFFPDSMAANVNKGMAHEMPLLLGSVFIFSIIVVAFIYYKNKKYISHEVKVFMILGIIATALTTVYFPWEWTWYLGEFIHDLFAKVQYSWRYLGIATVCFSFVIVLLWDVIRKGYSDKAAKIYALIVLGLCIIPTSLFYTDYLNHWNEVRYYSAEDVDSNRIGDDFYLPQGTDKAKLNLNEPTIIGDNATTVINTYEKVKNAYVVSVYNDSDATKLMEMPLVNYQGYRAYDLKSGNEMQILDSENHTVIVRIPEEYVGTIKVKFEEPWYWRMSEIVSLITLISICAYILTVKKTVSFHNKRSGEQSILSFNH